MKRRKILRELKNDAVTQLNILMDLYFVRHKSRNLRERYNAFKKLYKGGLHHDLLSRIYEFINAYELYLMAKKSIDQALTFKLTR